MLIKKGLIDLSQNQFLNNMAQRYGLKLGAQTIVAGQDIDEMIRSVKELNENGISCTIDNLGEFVFEREEAIKAKEQILDVIETVHKENVDAHISLKPTQLGLDIDYDFCLQNLTEIADRAKRYNVFINIDQ